MYETEAPEVPTGMVKLKDEEPTGLDPLANLFFKLISNNAIDKDKEEAGSITPTTKTKKLYLNVNFNSEEVTQFSEEVLPERGFKQAEIEYRISKLQELLNAVNVIDSLNRENEKIVLPEKFYSSDKIKEKMDQDIEKLKSELHPRIKDNNICISPDMIYMRGLFETIYQDQISSNTTSLNKEKPCIIHYGINPYALRDFSNEALESNVMHPIEIKAFQKGLDYLKSTESAENFIKVEQKDKNIYSNNTVLVDIFVREYGIIKFAQDIPETHTIVLWKKKDSEILIIDPSKSDFSNQLCNSKFLKTLFNKDFKISAEPSKLLYGSGGKITGYSTYEDKAPKPRDCIDIAVKVSFELQEQQRLGTSLSDIQNNMLQQISNEKSNATYLTNILLPKEIVIRELQSSDSDTRISAKKTLLTYQELSKKIGSELSKMLDLTKINNLKDIEELTETMKVLIKYKK